MSPGRTTLFATVIMMLGAPHAIAQNVYDPMSAARGKAPAVQEEEAVPLNPEFENMPDAPGMEETYFQCVGCHSMSIIKQQRLSDARWEYLWEWMVEEQGMPEADEETKKVILDYLKQHFSSER